MGNRYLGALSAALVLSLFISGCTTAQQSIQSTKPDVGVYSADKLLQMMTIPPCLEGFRSNQKGPLTKIDANGAETTDSTFTVEQIKITSEGLQINGRLYLPLTQGKVPLIVLTNGGGDGSRQIKSLSDWIAPILAHCGIAAFVHDKRETGESEGDYVKTTYNDYINDAGNCAASLSKHPRIDRDLIGVMGGSEGGRIAVMAAIRFEEVKFVISYAGTVVSPVDDRLYAQLNGMMDSGSLPDSLYDVVKPLWEKSFLAWAENNPVAHAKVNSEIDEWRNHFDRRYLPFKKEEMDTIPSFKIVLPTWNSLSNDYMSELRHFRKPWLAMFGEIDRIVPTEASVQNIIHYMSLSGNESYAVAVIPKCGHVPVNVETGRMVRLDNLVINWLNQNVLRKQVLGSGF